LVQPANKVLPALWVLKAKLAPPVRQARALPALQANRVFPVPLVSAVKPERRAPQEMWQEEALA
jgi:hypothetical protein